jgi:lipopolysaccharide export system protein LptA
MMFAWMWCLLLNGGVWLTGALAQAADPPVSSQANAGQVSTTITSRTMTVNNQENTAIFDGSVVLTRGPLVVYSDHMVVTFHGNGNGAEPRSPASAPKPQNNLGIHKETSRGREPTPTVSDRSIRMLEATGRVKIEKEDGRATCRKAVYYESEKKIVLTGDPVAWQKGTRVSGKRIIMFLEEDRSVVEGDSQVIIEGEGGGKR